MPIVVFEAKDQIPSEFHGEVKEKDGKFEVNLALNSKVAEFRTNNTSISVERDELKAKVDTYAKIVGEDPTEFETELTKLRKTQQQVEDGELSAKGDIDSVVASRTEQMRKNHEIQIKELGTQKANLEGTVRQLQTDANKNRITSSVQAVIAKKDSGVHPSALTDLSARAAARFKVEDDGSVVAQKTDGSIIYGADGVTPETVEEWISGLKETSPHFFIQSTGGGATGGDKRYGGMSKEDYSNLTAKEKLALANAETAKSMGH